MSESSKSCDSPNDDNKQKLKSDSSENVSELSAQESPTEDNFMMEKLTKIFAKNFKFEETEENEPKVEKLLDSPNIESIVKYISSGECKNIVAMVGAGISTGAGIPDFRSPGSGLYDNLAKYSLPSAECMFDINFFRENPLPFFDLAKQLFPGAFRPTPSHYFLKLLNDKDLLKRLYTQNIDTLERIAGIAEDKLVEAHGTFHTSHCIDCKQEYSFEWMKEQIFSDSLVPKCTKCESTVKPDIIFFGERLPPRFFRLADKDFEECDLLIIIGTSLTVQPFAGLVDTVRATTPRLLINKTKCGQSSRIARLLGLSGLDFDSEDNYRDVLLLGDCDDGCQQLAKALGWEQELNALIESADRSHK